MVVQLISWAPLLAQAYKAFKDKKINADTIAAAKDLGPKAYNVINTLRGSGSASTVTKSIIAPLTLFEESLTHQPYMLDLMTIINMRDIRDALTHINYQGKMGDVEITKLISSVSPNRSAGFMCLQGCEAIANAGNRPRSRTESALIAEKMAEAEVKIAKQKRDEDKKEREEKDKIADSRLRRGSHVRPEEFSNLTEYVPLALGRTVTASVFVDGKEITFPLTFRQVPIPSSTENLMLMFQSVIGGAGWSDRIKEYKAGGITRPELLTGIDEIKKEFKIRNNDMTGYYNEANKRDLNNKIAYLKTGIVSMNAMANTIIMSKDTANNIELEIGIRFGSSKMPTIRKHVKANTIVVVDDNRGVFEFYTSTSNIVEKYTLSQIKTKVNKENVDSLDSLIKLLNGR